MIYSFLALAGVFFVWGMVFILRGLKTASDEQVVPILDLREIEGLKKEISLMEGNSAVLNSVSSELAPDRHASGFSQEAKSDLPSLSQLPADPLQAKVEAAPAQEKPDKSAEQSEAKVNAEKIMAGLKEPVLSYENAAPSVINFEAALAELETKYRAALSQGQELREENDQLRKALINAKRDFQKKAQELSDENWRLNQDLEQQKNQGSVLLEENQESREKNQAHKVELQKQLEETRQLANDYESRLALSQKAYTELQLAQVQSKAEYKKLKEQFEKIQDKIQKAEESGAGEENAKVIIARLRNQLEQLTNKNELILKEKEEVAKKGQEE